MLWTLDDGVWSAGCSHRHRDLRTNWILRTRFLRFGDNASADCIGASCKVCPRSRRCTAAARRAVVIGPHLSRRRGHGPLPPPRKPMIVVLLLLLLLATAMPAPSRGRCGCVVRASLANRSVCEVIEVLSWSIFSTESVEALATGTMSGAASLVRAATEACRSAWLQLRLGFRSRLRRKTHRSSVRGLRIGCARRHRREECLAN